MKPIGEVLSSLPTPTIEEHEERSVKLNWIVLPDEAQAEITARQKTGQRHLVIIPESTQRGACPNCQGLGHVWIRFVSGGPYKTVPQVHRPETATWIGDAWYRVESKFYTCPACSDPLARIPYLFERSGLEPGERAWRVDFLAGMPGKEKGLAEACAILEQVPRPAGWHIFYGDFGVGKSGLIKAIVVQCVIAGVPAVYIRAADLLSEIRSTFSDKAQISESDLIDRYANFPLLAIDEVDRVGMTSWSMSALMAVLDARYNRRETHCTLLVTNLDPDYLTPGFEYLQSRMKDGSRVLIGGVSLRG